MLCFIQLRCGTRILRSQTTSTRLTLASELLCFRSIRVSGGKMKLIAYVLFAVSVLLVSAFARAESLMMHPLVRQQTLGKAIQVEKVDAIDTQSMKIFVSGVLPNACTPQPTPTISLEGNALVLRLTTPLQVEPCIDQAKPFGMILDLPVLVKLSGIAVEPGAIYELKTPGIEFIMNVSGAELAR